MSGEGEAEDLAGMPDEMLASSERATVFADAVMRLAELAEIEGLSLVVSVGSAVVTRAAGTESHEELVRALVASSSEALERMRAYRVDEAPPSGSAH